MYKVNENSSLPMPQLLNQNIGTQVRKIFIAWTAFYFTINDNRIRVCKAFLKATLDITDQPIRTALIKETESGFLDSDKRGRHGNQPKVDPEIKDSVRK